jgi:hypothetical protein
MQLGLVSNRAITAKAGRIFRKAKQIEDSQNVVLEYDDVKDTKQGRRSLVDFAYEGFSLTVNSFLNLVTDPKELKAYRERKYDEQRKERNTYFESLAVLEKVEGIQSMEGI